MDGGKGRGEHLGCDPARAASWWVMSTRCWTHGSASTTNTGAISSIRSGSPAASRNTEGDQPSRLTAFMGLPLGVDRRQPERCRPGVAPHHQQPLHGSSPSTRRPGNQTGCMEQVSPKVTSMEMHLASIQQAMHLRPRSQLVSPYVRRSLYGQPLSSLWPS